MRASSLLDAARKMGKSTSLPRVVGNKITFYEYSSEHELVPGELGILEPPILKGPVHPEVLIVPGVAFDPRGYRLGYGKGYYDRYLSESPTYSMGLAYSFQIVERIPETDHDRRVRALATEKGIIYFS